MPERWRSEGLGGVRLGCLFSEYEFLHVVAVVLGKEAVLFEKLIERYVVDVAFDEDLCVCPNGVGFHGHFLSFSGLDL